VNAYVQGDLNTIEWQLENLLTKAADAGVLQEFQSKLFIHRRRIALYQALIEEQRALLAPNSDSMPAAWLPARRRLPSAAHQSLREMHADAKQVHDIVRRNAERVSQSVELLMSLMSVAEGKLSVKQNQTLTFLTFTATFALPFNAVAAVLGIQTRFGPESGSFWVFWAASLSVWGLIWLIYFLYRQIGQRKVPRGSLKSYACLSKLRKKSAVRLPGS
jgi:Mg2+ and Co2+ transporter CorA